MNHEWKNIIFPRTRGFVSFARFRMWRLRNILSAPSIMWSGWRSYCLFKHMKQYLLAFFCYLDQRCFALFLQEALSRSSRMLYGTPSTRLNTSLSVVMFSKHPLDALATQMINSRSVQRWPPSQEVTKIRTPVFLSLEKPVVNAPTSTHTLHNLRRHVSPDFWILFMIWEDMYH